MFFRYLWVDILKFACYIITVNKERGTKKKKFKKFQTFS